VIIKSIISGEHYVLAAMKKHNLHRNNCFEIFGYDIILDSELKPWLLEVNLSPSLACDSPLDISIKANLLADTFNMISVRRFDRRKESLNKLKNRSKIGTLKLNNFISTAGGGAANDLYLS
jgi:tubulin polyglutamylase TTLL5